MIPSPEMTLVYFTGSYSMNIKLVLIGLFFLFASSHTVSGKLPTGPENSDYLILGDSAVGEDPYVINGVSIPVDFPKIDISVTGDTDSGYLFLSNWEGPPYIMILKNDGTPYYYQRIDNPSFEFKVQQNGLLSRTLLNDLKFPVGFITMDKNFLNQDTIRAADGYDSNIHELQVLSNGNSLTIANSYQIGGYESTSSWWKSISSC